MKERGILFSPPMVVEVMKPLFPKTQTRRIAKVPPTTSGWIFSPESDGLWWPTHDDDYVGDGIACPYGAAGDRLYVQEAHTLELAGGFWVRVHYHVDGAMRSIEVDHETLEKLRAQDTVKHRRGRPGRFLPRWASRTDLNVVSVLVERLRDITEADARAEGMSGADAFGPVEAREQFRVLWDHLNAAKAPWKSNPWVWRVEFKRVEDRA